MPEKPTNPSPTPPSAPSAEGGSSLEEGELILAEANRVLPESSVEHSEKAGFEGKADFVVAVLVALPEELEHLQDILPDDMTLADHPSGLGTREFKRTLGTEKEGGESPVEITYLFRTIGQMGELEMAFQTQGFYNELVEHNRTPHLMVLIGIAGAIKEVRLGDVVVADKVVRYLERSKILPDPKFTGDKIDVNTPFTVQFDLDVFVTDQRIINFLMTQFTVFDENFKTWVQQCEKDAKECTYVDRTWPTEKKKRFEESVDQLQKNDAIAFQPRVVVGAVASGPSVIASSRFKELLLTSHNRNYRACEMESGGFIFVLKKIESKENQRIPYMVLRGVSDQSDESKSKTDSVLAGRVRKMAMRNAIRVLFSLMQVPGFRNKLSSRG